MDKEKDWTKNTTEGGKEIKIVKERRRDGNTMKVTEPVYESKHS
jgi:hypothetical protein